MNRADFLKAMAAVGLLPDALRATETDAPRTDAQPSVDAVPAGHPGGQAEVSLTIAGCEVTPTSVSVSHAHELTPGHWPSPEDVRSPAPPVQAVSMIVDTPLSPAVRELREMGTGGDVMDVTMRTGRHQWDFRAVMSSYRETRSHPGYDAAPAVTFSLDAVGSVAASFS